MRGTILDWNPSSDAVVRTGDCLVVLASRTALVALGDQFKELRAAAQVPALDRTCTDD